jgi:hypothetical protein
LALSLSLCLSQQEVFLFASRRSRGSGLKKLFPKVFQFPESLALVSSFRLCYDLVSVSVSVVYAQARVSSFGSQGVFLEGDRAFLLPVSCCFPGVSL